jgi:hypothetical protein
MTSPIALLDANVLNPAPRRDCLSRLADPHVATIDYLRTLRHLGLPHIAEFLATNLSL